MANALEQLSTALAGRYRIDREIGAGGAARVYLAHDLRHDRPVAIKVLRPGLAEALGAERFLREIRITARLDHPHILTLLDSGLAEGSLYYVLPYVRGESLRARLDRERQLPVEDALRIVRQVGSALAFAHRQGVLHRDIKPGNILLHEGVAMLMDFGIAVRSNVPGERITEVGSWIGTPEYMSLEQATAERELDDRSDVYSLAAVLYEMLAGEPPFTGATPHALIAKRMVDPVPKVRRLRPTVPVAVEMALERALARDAADRPSSVTAFLESLDTTVAAPRGNTVAVLPFRSVGSDPENEFFADGITEDVIAHLAKIRGLDVISRASVMPFRDRSSGLQAIAAQLNATTVLDGSVRRAGDRVRIVAQLVDPDSGRELWSETYDRELTDIFAIQTDVALRIAHTLETTLTADEQGRIAKEPTRNLQAYRLYLQGRHWLLKFSTESMHRSITYFEEAIAHDPAYAVAHAGIAYAYLELGETGGEEPSLAYPLAETAARRALALDEELSAAHLALAYLRMLKDFDWTGAEAGLQRALELSPGNADAHDFYGRLCGAMRRFDEAIAHAQQAQDLDPLAHRVDAATQYLRAGRNEEALAVVRRSVEFEPGDPRGHATLGWALIRIGQVDEGLGELERSVRLSDRNSQWLGQLGQALALHDRVDQARAILEELVERSRHQFVSSYHLAYVLTGLGEHDQAIDILEAAIDQRAGAAYGINGSFLFTPLHGHPRYPGLLRKLNLA